MEAVLPTLRLLLKTSRAVVIVSHYGRPEPAGSYAQISKNKRIKFDPNFSLKTDAANLARLLKKKVRFVPDFDFDGLKAMVGESPRGSVFLLENLRFVKGEEGNDARFAKALSSLGDFYVNDAFAVSHRANASVAAMTKFLPSYAGLELEKEIESLSRVMQKPARPLVLVLGGAKAGDKLGVLGYFKNKADSILLGGGCANTILALRGMDVKKSLRDTDAKDLRFIAPLANRHNVIAPIDYVWRGGAILDLGPRASAISQASSGAPEPSSGTGRSA